MIEHIKYKYCDIAIYDEDFYRVTTHKLDVEESMYFQIIEDFDNLNDAKDYIDAKIIIDKYMD